MVIAASIALGLAVAARVPATRAPARTIDVMGSGKASTPPDRAVIDYWVAGEGKTPDEASRELAAKNQAVVQGLSGLLGPGTRITGGNVVLIETRGPECNGPNSYNAQPHLSEGPCAVTGYLATLQGNVRTSAVLKAGTAVGLAARLGARDVRLEGFELDDSKEARRQAIAQAMLDAREHASAIADSAGARLGPVVTIRDQNSGAGDIGIIGIRASAPPPPPPPPVAIDLLPHPIETQAQVYVTYELLP